MILYLLSITSGLYGGEHSGLELEDLSPFDCLGFVEAVLYSLDCVLNDVMKSAYLDLNQYLNFGVLTVAVGSVCVC